MRALQSTCGGSSVVECLPSKEKVAGSNPVRRSRSLRFNHPAKLINYYIQPLYLRIIQGMEFPRVLETLRIGNRGEAFLEFIMSKNCIMHSITGYKDIGIDYICEWLDKDTPSRLLFGIQVKTTEQKVTLIDKGINRRMNELETVKIKNPSVFKIKEETIEYWQGLNIPLFLFLIITNQENNFDCYYSRLTPILHKIGIDSASKIKRIKSGDFYLANNRSSFNAVKAKTWMDGGFVRDLFMDSVRCSYQSGNILYKDPRNLGIKWPASAIFPTVLGDRDAEYVKRLKTGLLLLEREGLLKVDPSFEQKIENMKKKFEK